MSEIGLVELRSVCTHVVDCPHSTPKWTDSGVVVLRSRNIRNGRLDLAAEPSSTTEEGFRERIRRAVPTAGDIVITREAPMGEVCMLPAGLRCCLGQRMVLLRPDPRKIDGRYLLFALQSPFMQHQILVHEGTGSTVSNLRIPALEALRVPTPSMEQQHRIAAVLGALDDKIELNRKMNLTLEEMARALFKSWFIDFDGHEDLVDTEIGPVPRGWRPAKLVEFARSGKHATTAGPFGSKLTSKHYSPAGVPVIRGANLSPSFGWFHDDGFVYVPSDYASQLTGNMAYPGDVIFTQRGTLGQVGLIPESARYDRYVLSQSQMKLTCAPWVPPVFIFLFFRLPSTIARITSNAVAAGVPHINLGFLREFPLVMPDRGTLERFGAALAPLHARIDTLAREGSTLSDLRDTLLPKLISGELRVPDAEAALSEAL